MRSEMAVLAKACRTFHLKLKRAERKSGKLKAENRELSQEVEAVRGRARTGVATGGSRTEMWTSAAIWSAVLLAGFHIVTKVKGNS